MLLVTRHDLIARTEVQAADDVRHPFCRAGRQGDIRRGAAEQLGVGRPQPRREIPAAFEVHPGPALLELPLELRPGGTRRPRRQRAIGPRVQVGEVREHGDELGAQLMWVHEPRG